MPHPAQSVTLEDRREERPVGGAAGLQPRKARELLRLQVSVLAGSLGESLGKLGLLGVVLTLPDLD